MNKICFAKRKFQKKALILKPGKQYLQSNELISGEYAIYL